MDLSTPLPLPPKSFLLMKIFLELTHTEHHTNRTMKKNYQEAADETTILISADFAQQHQNNHIAVLRYAPGNIKSAMERRLEPIQSPLRRIQCKTPSSAIYLNRP